jgi:mono/diheme cytochrome c family protein
MPSRARSLVLASAVAASALGIAACGSRGIEISESSPDHRAAEIFDMHCSACHTLDVVGAEGSAVKANTREYKDGPNFNVRKEEKADVLYAIRNGGFSSGPMPQDIIVGKEAEAVADFIAKYSGKQAAPRLTPNRAQPEGGSSGGTP